MLAPGEPAWKPDAMDVERGASRGGLARGALAFRWVALAWMTTIALGSGNFRRPAIAWASLVAALAWTIWITARRGRENRTELIVDLALCLWLELASGLVVPEGAVVSGRPFFATGYPLSAALVWGIAYGAKGGLFAGAVLGVGLIASRPLNGVPLATMEPVQVQSMMGAVVNYLAAGGAVGLVARLLAQSEDAVRRANEQLLAERERAARLAERESLARQIHDSVLQSLSMVHKRGREIARSGSVSPNDVEELAEVAARQERELRSLIMRPPEDAPTGKASLRRELEQLSVVDGDLDVEVIVVGSIWVERSRIQELSAAIKQAVDNVVEHAEARKITIFAEEDGFGLTITVRDDGKGFDYDEQRFHDEHKAGIVKSMKGRVEDLGGSMKIDSRPGAGTEVEFKIPSRSGP